MNEWQGKRQVESGKEEEVVTGLVAEYNVEGRWLYQQV